MQPERWRRIEELCRAARECDPVQRRAFLASACAGDTELQHEVESLLNRDESAPGIFDVPADDSPLTKTTLTPGAQLGPYQIEASLGKGGMGEVFRAFDARLQRVVAIKILKGGSAIGIANRKRFLQEARAASALNHPNIVAVYDVGAEAGIDF